MSSLGMMGEGLDVGGNSSAIAAAITVVVAPMVGGREPFYDETVQPMMNLRKPL